MLRKLKLRIRALLDRGAIGRELDEHLDQLTAELQNQGLSEGEARIEARRRFGNSARLHEQSHGIFAFPLLDDFQRDIRFALRNARRTPSVAFVCVLSIGLAIGVNTAVFSLVRDVFFYQPTTRAAGDLVNIRLHGSSHASLANLRDLNSSGGIESIAGYDIEKTVNWRDGDSVRQTPVMLVSENYFDFLETAPLLGRTFSAAEARAERNPHLVAITHRFWQRTFGGDANAVGRAMILNGRSYTIRGVLPEHFRPPTFLNVLPDLYVPASLELNPNLLNRASHNLMLVGRKKPRQSVEQARAALLTAAGRLEQSHPRENRGLGRAIRVIPAAGFAQYMDPDAVPLVAFAGVLLAAVFVVLWIACVNVAGILLARAAARRREIATRLAIGAGRARLVRQLLTEALLLCTMGCFTGLVLHAILVGALNQASLPLPVPVVFRIEAGGAVLFYAAALTAASTVLAGLIPALQATRSGLTSGLKLEEPQYGYRRLNWRNALVAGQVAVTVLLLSVALLFTRSLLRTQSLRPGFDLQHTAWARINLVNDRYPQGQAYLFATRALEAAANTPGIRSAALARNVPFNGFLRVGTPIHTRHGVVRTEYFFSTVSPDYFRTMGIPLTMGRSFTTADRKGAPHTIILNEALAKRLFANAPAVGEIIWFHKKEGPGVAVIGVTANTKHMTMGEDQVNAIYESAAFHELPGTEINVLVRAEGDGASVVTALQRSLMALDSTAAVDVAPLRSRLAFAYLPGQIGAVLIGSLGLLGLLLALIGIYGTLGFAVSRRTSEIGIRMALGATQWQVLRAVLGSSLTLLGVGAVLGLGLAVAAAQPLLIFLAEGIRPADPLTFGLVILLCLAAGAIAALVPARRAASVDPSRTLRVE